MQQGAKNGMKRVSANVDQMQACVVIKSFGMMINVDANVKNLLIKVYVIENIFGILVIAGVKVINHAMLVSIWIMKTVSVKKGWQIYWWRNVVRILMKQHQLEQRYLSMEMSVYVLTQFILSQL